MCDIGVPCLKHAEVGMRDLEVVEAVKHVWEILFVLRKFKRMTQ